MSVNTIVLLLVAVIAAWLAWDVARAWRVWRRFRGERLVTCPETAMPAAVRIDVPRAAATALVEGAPVLQLADCSRWALRGPCDEPCLGQAQAPANCVSAFVARWYDGQLCVYCRKPIGAVEEPFHHAALLDPAGKTCEWSEVPAERMPETLRIYAPVCWNCHVAETFRRAHPELVTDRERTRP